jgi:L-threonylcarbamoyladenylate synthase
MLHDLSGTPDKAGRVSPDEAVQLLATGQVVALPTETVYGLAARALDPDSVRRIFDVKGRPADNPVIVHVRSIEDARELAEVPPLAERLAAAYWPGPLTMVLPARPIVPDVVTAGRDTVAVRAPNHPVFQSILERLGEPLAAPSANPSGTPSPTCAEHVLSDYHGAVPVVDGGACTIGVESTVVQPLHDCVVLLRPGSVSREDLAAVVDVPIVMPSAAQVGASPGTRYRHYAPRACVRVFERESDVRTACGRASGRNSCVVLSRLPIEGVRDVRFMSRATLYDELRRADHLGVDEILVHCDGDVRADEAWMDRLLRAASTTETLPEP